MLQGHFYCLLSASVHLNPTYANMRIKLPCGEVNTIIVKDYCTVKTEPLKYHVIFIWGSWITKNSVEMANKRWLAFLALIYLEKDQVESGFHCFCLVYIWALVCTWLCLKEQTISQPVYTHSLTGLLQHFSTWHCQVFPAESP